MPHYRQLGEIPRRRHTQFRRPDGELYAEELMGVEGFSAEGALLYHEHLPTAIVDARVHAEPAVPLTANHPVLPRQLRTHKLDAGSADLVTGRQVLLANDDVRLAYAAADRPSPLYRNATGDECVYVESGTAVLETVGPRRARTAAVATAGDRSGRHGRAGAGRRRPHAVTAHGAGCSYGLRPS